jgi:hypothetical protein
MRPFAIRLKRVNSHYHLQRCLETSIALPSGESQGVSELPVMRIESARDRFNWPQPNRPRARARPRKVGLGGGV